MKTVISTNHKHLVINAIRSLVNKLRQHPEVYPIKYYKKGRKYRRNWKSELV